ncbi:hypothetical protein SESBI_48793 [Sesbania bispinosa]|nr:hypothetical protein SESBI_48793 [Sesbania bispinosa]
MAFNQHAQPPHAVRHFEACLRANKDYIKIPETLYRYFQHELTYNVTFEVGAIVSFNYVGKGYEDESESFVHRGTNSLIRHSNPNNVPPERVSRAHQSSRSTNSFQPRRHTNVGTTTFHATRNQPRMNNGVASARPLGANVLTRRHTHATSGLNRATHDFVSSLSNVLAQGHTHDGQLLWTTSLLAASTIGKQALVNYS